MATLYNAPWALLRSTFHAPSLLTELGRMMDSVSPLSVLVALVLGAVLLLWALQCSPSWRGATKSGARLPKGSFGWPVIGETIQLAKDPRLFASSHVKRYGSVFKSNLLMNPTIVGSTPDFGKFVLGNPKLFHIRYPPMVSDILGPKAFMINDGPRHSIVKKIIIKQLSPETLKTKVGVLDDIVLQHLSSWAEQGTVVSKIKAKEITLDSSMFLNLGLRDLGKTAEGRELLQGFDVLNHAMVSIPLKFPGTNFWKGLKAKARLSEMIKKMLSERKEKKTPLNNDILGALLSARDDDEAAREAEQQGIRNDKARSLEGPRLNWEDVKKMEYTRKFVLETLRMVSIGPMYVRKAVEDTEYKGFLIPKGWSVGMMHHYVHDDPDVHLDPTRFNPDRFDVTPKPLTFIPFSFGSHMCPGGEVSRILLSISIHHLCTAFKHESAAPDKGVEYNCFMLPVTGYPIKVSRL